MTDFFTEFPCLVKKMISRDIRVPISKEDVIECCLDKETIRKESALLLKEFSINLACGVSAGYDSGSFENADHFNGAMEGIKKLLERLKL